MVHGFYLPIGLIGSRLLNIRRHQDKIEKAYGICRIL